MGNLLPWPCSQGCFTASLCEDPETDGLHSAASGLSRFQHRRLLPGVCLSSPGVWTGTFPLLNMEVAYGKRTGENSTSNQNTSVFKYSELYRAGIKVKMGKLEVSACCTFLNHGLATLRERDSVGCFQCQSATEACCYAILRVTEVSIVRRSENTTRIAVLQIQRQMSCLKGHIIFPNMCSSLGLTDASTKQLC